MATDAGPVTTQATATEEGAAGTATERPLSGPDVPIEPLTGRILGRLESFGGPEWAWILAWAAIPLLSPLVFSTAVRASGDAFGLREFMDFLATQAGLAWACLVLLWGCRVLCRLAIATRDDLAHAAPEAVPAGLFARASSIAAPLVLTGAAAAVTSIGGWLTYGPLAPIAALPLLVVYLLPILTFVWVYVAVLADIDRLGGLPIVLDRFPQDRTLGLERIGALASTGLGLLLVASVPVLLAGSDEPVTLALSLVVVIGAVGAFALSMWRLHRQMSAAKAGYVATARRLYREAYDPVRADPTLAALVTQSEALGVAKALDDRAQDVSTWPIDTGTARFVGVLVTSVVTSLIVRALFAAIGF